MVAPEQILKQYWGYDGFRPLQREIITSVTEGQDTLVLLPTGGGKSVCYQVPALIKEGVCIVVSPLIALMQDQVARLNGLDIPAACVHSGMRHGEVKSTLSDVVAGEYKLLYVSPERLQTRVFSDCCENMDVSLIAVDEAHCISQWGHDFRPDYRRIISLREAFPSAPVLALTATATPRVQEDIVGQLNMRRAAIFRQDFSRNNIFISVRYSENKNADAQQALAEGSSIVYCRSRRQTELLASRWAQEGVGATFYHAGLSRERREEAQKAWMQNEARVMVATTAFGMGIDKSDVRAVVHYDAPEDIESYYQEAGRGGRDGKPATAMLLYNSGDIKRLEDSTGIQYPPEEYLRQVYQAVADYLQVPISAQPDRYFPFDLSEFCSRFGLEMVRAMPALKLLEREGLWTLTESVYTPATVRFIAGRHVLDGLHQANARLGYIVTGLLRIYSGIFHYPATVREFALARQLKIPKEDILRSLDELAAMQVIEYRKAEDGPRMLFHHYRVDSRHLRLDMARIARLRKWHEERTAAMIQYLRNTGQCRERMILGYFGEKTDRDCGHCDVCRDKNRGSAGVPALQKVLLDELGKGGVSLAELTARLPAFRPADIIGCIRRMADDQLVRMANGCVHLAKVQ